MIRTALVTSLLAVGFFGVVTAVGVSDAAAQTQPMPRPRVKGRTHNLKVDSSPQQAAVYWDAGEKGAPKNYGIAGYTPDHAQGPAGHRQGDRRAVRVQAAGAGARSAQEPDRSRSRWSARHGGAAGPAVEHRWRRGRGLHRRRQQGDDPELFRVARGPAPGRGQEDRLQAVFRLVRSAERGSGARATSTSNASRRRPGRCWSPRTRAATST